MIVRQFLIWVETAPPARKAEAAHALARAYLYSDIDEETRGGMEAAMTVLLDDSSPDVRYALADALASSPEAPRHVLLSLAADQPEIAELVVARSPLLIDAELVDIVAEAADPLQIAVASRARVSSAVSAAIAEVGEEAACRTLIANQGAEIARISFRRIAERLGDDPTMREALLDRPGLPPDVRQMLIQRLGIALGDLGLVKSWVAEDRAKTLVREACDRATVALAADSEIDELPALVEHLRVTGQLTTALILRAVCAGNVAFFEAVLTALAGVPQARVASLVRGGRTSALRAVYDTAGLPPRAFEAFTAALEAWREVVEDESIDRYRLTRQVVESVLARYEQITDGEALELTTLLRRIAADQAREAARDYAAACIAA